MLLQNADFQKISNWQNLDPRCCLFPPDHSNLYQMCISANFFLFGHFSKSFEGFILFSSTVFPTSWINWASSWSWATILFPWPWAWASYLNCGWQPRKDNISSHYFPRQQNTEPQTKSIFTRNVNRPLLGEIQIQISLLWRNYYRWLFEVMPNCILIFHIKVFLQAVAWATPRLLGALGFVQNWMKIQHMTYHTPQRDLPLRQWTPSHDIHSKSEDCGI